MWTAEELLGARRVLVVVAHPDDESYSCGGTIALLVQRGAQVRVVSCSRGEAGNPDGIDRRDELRAACTVLGVTDVACLEFPDSAMSSRLASLVVSLESEIAAFDPELILTHGADGAYGHVDHLAVYDAITQAAVGRRIGYFAFPRGAFASVWRKLRRFRRGALATDRMPPNGPGADRGQCVIVSIEAVADRKRDALLCHVSQMPPAGVDGFLDGAMRDLMGEEWFEVASP